MNPLIRVWVPLIFLNHLNASDCVRMGVSRVVAAKKTIGYILTTRGFPLEML